MDDTRWHRFVCSLLGHYTPGFRQLTERDMHLARWHWVRCARCTQLLVLAREGTD